MGLKGITMNTPPEAEPNIYAEDDAAIYQALFGKDGVSSIGQACAATVISNNKVRISDGVIVVEGHVARIPYGEYEECEIENGQSGKNRNDVIMAKFETTGTGGIDTFTCEVLQGEAGTTAKDPEITKESLYEGGKVRELPLYRVKIEGLSIVAVEKLFETIETRADLANQLTQLNSKIIDTGYVSSPKKMNLNIGKVMLATLSDGSMYLLSHVSSGIVNTPIVVAKNTPFTINISGNTVSFEIKNGLGNLRVVGVYF